MSAPYHIQLALPEHIPHLAGIELAAVELFSEVDIPPALRADTTSEKEFLEVQRAGRLWVALADADIPIGFAHVEIVDGVAHLEEIDVLPEYGRRGIGAALVRAVCEWAAREYDAVTLTTFVHLPWNAPFYRGLGFREIPPSEIATGLAAIIEDEGRRGLDLTTRIAMRLELAGRTAPCDGD